MDSATLIQIAVLFGVMFILLFAKVPIFLSLAGASIAYALIFPGKVPVAVFAQSLAQGIGKESYAAIVFYFLLGEIMNSGGISERLLKFGMAAIGHIRGSLSHINILASMIFAGVSGSANADTAAIGSMMIPIMKKQGYPAGYAAAVTEMSSVIGPIIPPSGGLVILAVYLNYSARKLLLGGLIPGIIMGLFELVVSVIIARRRNFPRTQWGGWNNVWVEFKSSFWAFMLPVATIFCLIAGIGTVVEIGALSCFFAYIIAIVIYKEMNFKQFVQTFMRATVLTGRVLCSIATAGVFVWIIASMGVANKLAMMISASGMSGAALLFLCVAILFVAGMVLNVNVLLMVIIPVMIPSILAAGIHPIHFGIVAMLVAQMGVNTPPVGSLIYLTASIAECPASEVIRESLPYLAVLIALIVLLIFCPQLRTFFPAMVS